MNRWVAGSSDLLDCSFQQSSIASRAVCRSDGGPDKAPITNTSKKSPPGMMRISHHSEKPERAVVVAPPAATTGCNVA